MEQKELNTTEPKSSKQTFPTMIVVVLLLVAGGAIFLKTVTATKTNQVTSHETTTPAVAGTQETEQITPTEGEGTVQTFQVEEGSFYFKPDTITVKKGIPVKIVFTDAAGVHNFVIDQLDVTADTISAGGTTTVTFTPDTAGTYEFYCSIGNHREQGMVGKLIVE